MKTLTTTEDYTLQVPKYVGYWVLDDFYIAQKKRPSLWKRFWMWLFIGVTWKHL
jgi:hypothetical protein